MACYGGIHTVLLQQILKAGLEMLSNVPVGLVGVHHVHGTVQEQDEPRCLAPNSRRRKHHVLGMVQHIQLVGDAMMAIMAKQTFVRVNVVRNGG
jgi:hypothetical protein